MNINWYGTPNDKMGYGRMYLGLTDALKGLGVEVHDHDEGPICETAIWCAPPNHVRRWREHQRPMVFTMFETDQVPAGLHASLYEFDTVFVPSKQNVEVFSQHHDHVVQCPLGIDPRRWPLVERPPINEYFNFYMPGQGARKGTDVGFYAFCAAFPRTEKLDPQPRLICKSIKDDGFTDERLEKWLGVLDSGEERALYDTAHVSLNLARGEGWGLMPMQAISMGIPTILTDAHGHADFSHLGLPVPATTVPADEFVFGDCGNWWEPDFDITVDIMREVYENYPAYLAMAQKCAGWCHREFNWTNSAQILVDEVGESDLLADPGHWYLPNERLFKLRVTRFLDPFIGGIQYEFDRNQEYDVPADVRRVILQAGYLDDSCLLDVRGKMPDDPEINLGIKKEAVAV